MVFRSRGLTQRVSPPVSLVLATHVRDYLAGLRVTAYDGPPDSKEAVAAINHWLGIFAGACKRAAGDAMRFEERIRAIQDEWRTRLGAVRSDAAALKLIDVLPGAPAITMASAQLMIDRSLRATIDAMKRLTDAGVVTPAHLGCGNRSTRLGTCGHYAARLLSRLTFLGSWYLVIAELEVNDIHVLGRDRRNGKAVQRFEQEVP